MICPRCKEKISEQDKVCSNCGLKLKTICPRCKEPNKLGQPKCAKCNLTLIRFCPKCKTPNFPHVKNCRKCGFKILKKQEPTKKPAPKKRPQEKIKEIKTPDKPIKPASEPVTEQVEPSIEPVQEERTPTRQEFPPEIEELRKELTRNETGMFLQKLITQSEHGYLINITAPDGIGKTTIISALTQNLQEQQLIWLVGQCDPSKRNIPYSFFRELICTLLAIPVLTQKNDEIKKSIEKIFETNLEITDKRILNTVYKIVLNDNEEVTPKQKGRADLGKHQINEENLSSENKKTNSLPTCHNIEENRQDIQEAIWQFISSLNTKASLLFVAEDFEYIDKASFDCIKYLLKKGFLTNKKNFMLINNNNSVDITKLFPEEVSAKRFLQILVKPLINDELNQIVLSMMNNEDLLPENLKYKIFRQARGLPIYAEQALWYLFQTRALYSEETQLKFDSKYSDIELIPDFPGLFRQRLQMLQKLSPDVEKIVYTASLFGMKFIPRFIQAVIGIEDQKMQENLQLLVNNGIFSIIDQQTLAFKHVSLWKLVSELALKNEAINELSQNILAVIQENTSANSTFMAKIAGYSGNPNAMFHFVSMAAQESYSLGDILSYTDNQIKVHELLSSIDISTEEKEAKKLAISEEIGKVNYELNPAIAVKYLSEVIEQYEQQENVVKIVELTGFLSKSCELTGDFLGVLDCAEKAIILTEDEASDLELILLSFSKLNASFNLGRLEETIVSARDEILPVLSNAISKNETLPGLSIEELKQIEYETELILSKALVFQGNKNAVDLLNKIQQKAEKENQHNYEAQALLGRALFTIIQGDINSCEDIIAKFKEKSFSLSETDETKSLWLLISILSNMTTGNFEQARGICYSALSIAKESKNFNIFALVKLLSGFFYQHFQHYKEATSIYEEIANYCSETKMATGALYAWYFAAEAELQTGNPEKAKEIAEKAIDVSQKPNINNLIAIILLSKLLAEIKIINGDLEGAQINIENALNIADENNLYYLLLELYIILGKIYQENSSLSEDNKDYICSCAYRSYTKALSFGEKIDSNFLMNKVEKVLTNLDTFCKLSEIKLEKG